jgi:thiol-disulfide isomerase/thioredoxin
MARMMMRVVLLCAVALATVSGHSLTKANYEELSAGKTVFVKFQAPWCCNPCESQVFVACAACSLLDCEPLA